jgi:hypothetical protein
MAKTDVPVYATQMSRILTRDGLSVREDVLYSDTHGQENEKTRKRADESLNKLRNVLPGLLEPDETILYVVKNCQAPLGMLEQLLLGWQAYLITATTLVFTNLRILHFGVDTRGNWKRTIKSVRWGDIQEAKVKGLLSKVLQLRYGNGKKEKYWRLRGKDGRKVKDVVAALIPASRGESTATGGIVSICPQCQTVLMTGIYKCGQCGLEFKNEKTLATRTILLPGGGYLYAEIWVAGVLAFLVEGILTLALLFFALQAAGIAAITADENGHIPTRGELWAVVFFFALIVGLNKALEYVHCRRVIQTFLPLKK